MRISDWSSDVCSSDLAARFVTIDRGLPSIEWRASALTISDVVSGLAIALFGALSLVPRTKTWAQWAVAFVGIWLFFAPLIFWSPSAAQYNNHLQIGRAPGRERVGQ